MGAVRLFESLSSYNTSVETDVTLGMEFYVTKQAWLTHLWYKAPSSGNLDDRYIRVWEYNTDGTGLTVIVSPHLIAPTAFDAWVDYQLPTPIELNPAKRYKVDTRTGGGCGYVYVPHTFDTSVVNDFLVAPSASGAFNGKQGTYTYGPLSDFPPDAYNNTYYGQDVTVTDVNPNPTVTYPQVDVLKAGAWARADVLGVGTGTTIRPVELLFTPRTLIDGGTPSNVSGGIVDGNSPTGSMDGNS